MQRSNKLIFIFWFVIFSLFFIPVSNSFYVNLVKLFKSVFANREYKSILSNLYKSNKSLENKVNYYKTSCGVKMLIKDRLNKVEDGEYIIKFDKNPVRRDN